MASRHALGYGTYLVPELLDQHRLVTPELSLGPGSGVLQALARLGGRLGKQATAVVIHGFLCGLGREVFEFSLQPGCVLTYPVAQLCPCRLDALLHGLIPANRLGNGIQVQDQHVAANGRLSTFRYRTLGFTTDGDHKDQEKLQVEGCSRSTTGPVAAEAIESHGNRELGLHWSAARTPGAHGDMDVGQTTPGRVERGPVQDTMLPDRRSGYAPLRLGEAGLMRKAPANPPPGGRAELHSCSGHANTLNGLTSLNLHYPYRLCVYIDIPLSSNQIPERAGNSGRDQV